jgi:radical SAM superfamily enzyme YgiQ (UPF0313 family)
LRRPRKSDDFKEYSYVKKFSDSEIRLNSINGNRGVALIFPNNYTVAASSLSWSWVQQLFWEYNIPVERYFYEKWFKKFYSIESFTPLDENKVFLFSFHFEPDIENIVDILKKQGIPILKNQRNENHPTIIIGGAITFFNLELVKPIADVIVIGDLEDKVEQISEGINILLKDKESGLKFLDKIDNVIVNEQKNYTLSNFDISKKLPASHIITRFSEFGEKRLIEIGRGCIRRCKFCVMGNTKKPVKFVKPELIKELLKDEKYPIGIISATITDYPWLDELLDILEYYEIKFSVSSMRADGITKRLLRLLKESGQNTYTIAPEGISQKIRDVMLKDLNEEELLTALEMGRMENFSSVKLYYIVGFDEEDNEDFNELKSFIDKVKKLGYKSITLSINPLIPKKNTPFYGRKFINERRYNEIRKWMYENLKGVKLHFESYKLSKKQNLYNNISLEELINLFSK